MMKVVKSVSLLLAGVSLFAMAGCGSDSSGGSNVSNSPNVNTKNAVAITTTDEGAQAGVTTEKLSGVAKYLMDMNSPGKVPAKQKKTLKSSLHKRVAADSLPVCASGTAERTGDEFKGTERYNNCKEVLSEGYRILDGSGSWTYNATTGAYSDSWNFSATYFNATDVKVQSEKDNGSEHGFDNAAGRSFNLNGKFVHEIYSDGIVLNKYEEGADNLKAVLTSPVADVETATFISGSYGTSDSIYNSTSKKLEVENALAVTFKDFVLTHNVSTDAETMNGAFAIYLNPDACALAGTYVIATETAITHGMGGPIGELLVNGNTNIEFTDGNVTVTVTGVATPFTGTYSEYIAKSAACNLPDYI